MAEPQNASSSVQPSPVAVAAAMEESPPPASAGGGHDGTAVVKAGGINRSRVNVEARNALRTMHGRSSSVEAMTDTIKNGVGRHRLIGCSAVSMVICFLLVMFDALSLLADPEGKHLSAVGDVSSARLIATTQIVFSAIGFVSAAVCFYGAWRVKSDVLAEIELSVDPNNNRNDEDPDQERRQVDGLETVGQRVLQIHFYRLLAFVVGYEF
jgi:hypothetical protein